MLTVQAKIGSDWLRVLTAVPTAKWRREEKTEAKSLSADHNSKSDITCITPAISGRDKIGGARKKLRERELRA